MEKIKTASPSQIETEGTSLKENLENRHNSKNWAKPNRHSIRKNWAILVSFVIALFAFTTCEKSDTPDNDGNGNNSGNNGNTNVSDPEGTILVAMRNSNNGTTLVLPDGCNNYSFYIYDDNFEGSYFKFATIGKLSGLGNITSIPTNGWADKVAVLQGYGYVAKFEKTTYNPSTGRNDLVEKTTYVRIYVDSYITSTSGGIMGANVKYQSPFNP